MATIGYATLSIIPSLKGVSKSVEGQLGGLKGAGRKAGKEFGTALAGGVDQAAKQVKTATDKVVTARNKAADAAGKLRTAEAQLESLRAKGVTDAGRLAAAEEKVSKAKRDTETASKRLAATVKDESSAQDKLARAQKDVADSAGKGAAESRKFSGAVGKLGDKAGGAISGLEGMAVAAAGIAGAMKIASSAMDLQAATANMNAALGATGADAERFGELAGQLYGRGLGDSMADVATAVGAAASTFPDLGAAELEKASEHALRLADVFNLDVADAAQTASQLITNGMARDSTEAMDLLTASLQRVPAAMRGEIPEILNEYGKHFKTFGLSGEDALGLIVDMAPQGTIALDKAGDAIKELSVRATDGSKLTAGAFEAIGADGEKMATAIATGGPSAGAAMQEIAAGLLTIQDPAQRAQQAIALFGTPLEDLGVDQIPAFLTSLSGASGSMGDFEGAADGLAAKSETAQGKIKKLTRGIQEGLIQALGGAIGFLDENRALLYTLAGVIGTAATAYVTLRIAATASAVAQGVMAAATGTGTAAIAANKIAMGAHLIATTAMSVGTKVAAAAQWLFNAALSANPIGLIVIAIAALVAGIVWFFTKTELGRKIWEKVWGAIKAATKAVVSWFTDTAFPAISGFITKVTDVWQGLVAAATAVWEGIKERFTSMVDFFKELPGKIASAAKGMWDGISNAFKAMVNGLITMWNGLAAKLSFTVPDIPGVPRRGEKVQPIPSIPTFGGGGFTGNGGAGQVAGVVHGGEFVLSKRTTDRLEAGSPGLLDWLNRGGLLPGFAAGGLVEGTSQLRQIISDRFGITNIGGYRGPDKYGEHSSGRALDVMVGSKSKGDAVKDFALANAEAIDLKWAIWQQRTWKPDGSSTLMEDRGSPTQNHMDHVHIFSGPGITNGLLAELKTTDMPEESPGGIGDSASATPAPAPSSSGGGSSLNVPDSFSGLAGFAAGKLGEGVGATKSGSDLGVFGDAAGEAIGGQVSSALGVLGVPDSPGWLKGLSTFIGGVSATGPGGVGIGGGSAGDALGGVGSMFGNVAPTSATAGMGGAQPPDGMHGANAGQQPGPGPVYNIQARDTEDAFIRAQRQERERSAAKLASF